MMQNLLVIISLCFGPHSLLITFLKDWADHMYENRLMYSSLQASDPLFFAKVLFAIDDVTPYRSTGNHQFHPTDTKIAI